MQHIMTQRRIELQLAVIAKLVPGSSAHEIATKILLLLQDSLYVHQQIDVLLAELETMKQRAGR